MAKLFRVQTKMSQQYSTFYVVGVHEADAAERVEKYLDKKDLGFHKDRCAQTVELLAEDADYPRCGTILILNC